MGRSQPGSEDPRHLDTVLAAPPHTGDDDALDWEFRLEVDDSRRATGVIEVQSQFAGRAIPLPLPDPKSPGAA